MRYRLAVRYAIEGDLRFISHHDTLRLFERALMRSSFPVRFSEGFNPRPRMRLALPRPVGVASLDELLVVELIGDFVPEDARMALARQMPEGIRLLSAEKIAEADERRPRAATYELPLEDDSVGPLNERATEFMAAKERVVQRHSPKTRQSKPIDLRSFIRDMRVADRRLTWTQTISQDGTARIGEVLEALALPSRDHLHRVSRQTVCYEP